MRQRRIDTDEPQTFAKLAKIVGILVAVALLLGIGWAAYAHFVLGYVWLPVMGLRDKTVWDVLELLIVPLALVIGAWWLNRSEKQTEREIAAQQREQDREIARERRYDATLESYFDRMTKLLLDEGLRESESGDEVRKIARTRTLAVLRRLNGKHKGEVVQFLIEAELIRRDSTIISLRGADLVKADLKGANLIRVDLREAKLMNAFLYEADLRDANLQAVNLSSADMEKANLRKADLWGADLQMAFLYEADLREADLSEALLCETDLRKANLQGTNLRESDL